MLTLEIELLTSVYRAALPDGSGAEWPPHPERVYSALVQAWGDGGCDRGEREALEWLERQSPPWIEADREEDCTPRDAPTVYVPPNDDRGVDLSVLPDRRRRQGRWFHAAIPAAPVILLHWPEAAASAQDEAALAVLAHRVASLGHSSSLVRFAFTDAQPQSQERLWLPSTEGSLSVSIPHPGRLENLARWHTRGERPRAGWAIRYKAPSRKDAAKPRASVFGPTSEWFVFEHTDGFRPDIIAFAHVAKRVRDSLMAHGPQPVPEVLSGHTKDGGVTTRPHVAVVPLANVGWTHATGDLLGFAVVLPREVEAADRRDVLKALAGFARIQDGDQAIAELHFGKFGTWRLEHIPAPVRSSLKPGRWCGAAKVWASVTPVLLDRFPDHGEAIEEARLVSVACRNIGLPEPVAIEFHKHSAVKGALPAYPARGDRRRPDWSFPEGAKYARRPRRHVVLRFADSVQGPLILGAGRFHGLGLCLPLDEASNP
jgi:CRISPR-associated protein Csb2